MKTKANANKTQTQWAARVAAIEAAEKRRTENIREARSVLRHVHKHGVDSDGTWERVERLLKDYIKDLKLAHEG